MVSTLSAPRINALSSTTVLPGPCDADTWQLIERAQTGDLAAFNGLYERYANKVFWTIYFRVRNWHLAEDIAQHVWVRAIGAINRWQNIGSEPVAFLITIALNLVADYFKSSRRRREIVIPALLDVDHDEQPDPTVDVSPESVALADDTRTALLAAINQLNAEQRTCLVLRFYSDFSSREIAGVMGKSEGAVKALQYRAVRTLARRLGEEWLASQHPE